MRMVSPISKGIEVREKKERRPKKISAIHAIMVADNSNWTKLLTVVFITFNENPQILIPILKLSAFFLQPTTYNLQPTTYYLLPTTFLSIH